MLDRLAKRRIALFGFGLEGRSMAKVLHESAFPFTVIADHRIATLEQVKAVYGKSVEVLTPKQISRALFDVIIVSPGISWYRPELVQAREDGIEVTSPASLWLEDYHDRKILGVTGTKGKSTTASLAAVVLRSLGYTVALGGNIGVPVTNFYREPDHDIYVIEFSSYQATGLVNSPEAAVLTSLAPDHLTWHGNVEQYYHDKLNLFREKDRVRTAVNGTNAESCARTGDLEKRILYGRPEDPVHADDQYGYVQGEKVVRLHDLHLPGFHNRLNLLGALAGVYQLLGKVPEMNDLGPKLSAFHGLPSRLMRIASVGGIEYYDDALASNAFAVTAALDVFHGKPLTLIMGGEDRGIPYDAFAKSLRKRLQRATNVVLLPGSERIASAIRDELAASKSFIKLIQVTSLPDAVLEAALVTPKGGVVLFSPGAPTPTKEGSYKDRSEIFQKAVESLQKKTG